MHGYLHVVVDHAGHCANREFAELPRLCPICEQHRQPFRIAAHCTDTDDSCVDFAFQCSNPECRHVFVASYHRGPTGGFELDTVTPERRHEGLTLHV